LNISGYANTALGYRSLYSNGSNSNTAVGALALNLSSTGYGNSAIGSSSLALNTAGSENSALGVGALGSNSSGSSNTAVGAYAGPNAATRSNTTAIGSGASCTQGNQVRLGNAAVSNISGIVAFTASSDARFKRNIQTDVHGIDFIMKLRPVTYNFDVHKMAAFLKEDTQFDANGNRVARQPDPEMVAAREERSAIRYTGFLAQEVEAAAKELGYDFSAVSVPKDEDDMYGLAYSEFVVPLVKAVQEQQQLIEEQQKQINALKEQMQALMKR